MFHGSTSYGAFSVTDGSSNTRLISGEKSSTPGRRAQPARAALVEQAAREAAAARVAGDEEVADPGSRRAAREDRERVVERGGVRELGREPVVGDEDLAARRAGEPRDEERVHVRRRADVAAAVQVQHLQRRRRVARPEPQAGHAGHGFPCHGHVLGAHPRRQDGARDRVERLLDRAELVDRERGRVAEERAGQLARHADADVAHDAAGAAPRLPERDAQERRAHRLGQSEQVDRGDRRGGGRDFGPVGHHHGVRTSAMRADVRASGTER